MNLLQLVHAEAHAVEAAADIHHAKSAHANHNTKHKLIRRLLQVGRVGSTYNKGIRGGKRHSKRTNAMNQSDGKRRN